MVTMDKVRLYDKSVLNGKGKIKIHFSNGENRTFIEGIDDCYITIARLFFDKLRANHPSFDTEYIDSQRGTVTRTTFYFN